MKKNMGTLDRILRTLVALLIVVLYFSNMLVGTFGTILLIIAAIFLLTSLFSYCPMYAIFKVNTCNKKK